MSAPLKLGDRCPESGRPARRGSCSFCGRKIATSRGRQRPHNIEPVVRGPAHDVARGEWIVAVQVGSLVTLHTGRTAHEAAANARKEHPR